jgi:hypothetical protein
MATMTENQRTILMAMGEGKIIRILTFLNEKPKAHLVERPYRVPGQFRTRWGTYQKEINYNDFKALYLNLKYLKEMWFSNDSYKYYELNQAGKATMMKMVPATIVRGFPMHCDMCRNLTMDMNDHGGTVFSCNVDYKEITERRIAECQASGDYSGTGY